MGHMVVTYALPRGDAYSMPAAPGVGSMLPEAVFSRQIRYIAAVRWPATVPG